MDEKTHSLSDFPEGSTFETPEGVRYRLERVKGMIVYWIFHNPILSIENRRIDINEASLKWSLEFAGLKCIATPEVEIDART